MNRIHSLMLILGLALMIGGCAHKPAAPAPTTGGEVAPPSGTTAGAAGSDSGQATPLGGQQGAEAALLGKTAIYFDFDSSEIKPEFAPIIAAHGRKLGGERSLKVRLEGNTDERGSAEYNIALGERRAQSVKRALLLQGVTDVQMTTVSYGEERPVAQGHDETSWAQNRRVDIVYMGGR